MFNFVVFFEVYLALVFQGAGLAVLCGDASSCSFSSLAQLVDTGCRGRSPDRSSVVAVFFLYVYAQVGKSFVAPGEFGFPGFPLLFRFRQRVSLGAWNGAEVHGTS